MKLNSKHMLICGIVVLIAITLFAVSGSSAGYGLLFLIPCMLMMGMMMWMMMGGGGSDGPGSRKP